MATFRRAIGEAENIEVDAALLTLVFAPYLPGLGVRREAKKGDEENEQSWRNHHLLVRLFVSRQHRS